MEKKKGFWSAVGEFFYIIFGLIYFFVIIVFYITPISIFAPIISFFGNGSVGGHSGWDNYGFPGE